MLLFIVFMRFPAKNEILRFMRKSYRKFQKDDATRYQTQLRKTVGGKLLYGKKALAMSRPWGGAYCNRLDSSSSREIFCLNACVVQ